MTLYSTLKLIHIFAAIIAVGFNLSYPIWLLKGRKENDHLLFSLEGIRILDNFIANPFYIISLISGLSMCYGGSISILKTGWILYSLIIYFLMSVIGFGIYTPLLNKQIKILKKHGSNSPQYLNIDKKQALLGGLLFLFAICIVFLMILKPTF